MTHSFAEELQAIVAALVGGARYGVKIRLPHALVMTLLFRRDLTSKEKIQSVVNLAMEHASNLGAFATIYKLILVSLKRVSLQLRGATPASEKSLGRLLLSCLVDGPLSQGTHSLPASMAGHPERPYHALVAGAVGGYFVWGRYSSVNHQIILYLTSRVLIGMSKRLWEHYHGVSSSSHTDTDNRSSRASLLDHPHTYPFLAATVWGLVMVLFEESPHVLHKSLKQSMDEIYRYQFSSSGQNVSSSAAAAGGEGNQAS